MWVYDFLQVSELFFRSLFAFFIVELQSRKVIHVGVMRFPTDVWNAEPLRERLRMDKCRSTSFAIMMASLGPVSLVLQQQAASSYLKRRITRHEPMPDDERFLGSVRRACLDHVLILREKQLHRVLRSSLEYFNEARPHQGIQQQIPELPVPSAPCITSVIR
jgi:putative transposase